MATGAQAVMRQDRKRLVDALMGYEPLVQSVRNRYLATFHTRGTRGAPNAVHGYGVKDLDTGEMVFFEAVTSFGWDDNEAALKHADGLAAALNRGGAQAERVRRRLAR